MIRIAPAVPPVVTLVFALLLLLPLAPLPAATLAEGANGYLRFTPAGDALLFATRERSMLKLHSLAAGTTTDLTLGLPGDQKVDGPFFAATPDGTRILVASFPVQGSYDPAFQHLYQVAPDGTGFARVVDGFQDSLALVGDQGTLGDDCVVFRRRQASGAFELLAYHYADRALIRLSRPDHDEARVTFMARSRASGAVVYVGDDERPGHFRLWRVGPRGEDRSELSAGLPRDFVVQGELPGRSDRDHDKDGVKLLETSAEVLFTAQDPATGFGAFDPRHLYRVSLGGGPVDEVFRTDRGEGTFEFWPVESRGEVVVRAHVPESNHYAVELASSMVRPLHPPAQGWQGSYQVLAAPEAGRVFWFGDLETQDVRGYLYSSGFDGSELRRHRFEVPYDERGSLFPVLDDPGATIFFRGGQKGPSGFELFAVSTRDGTQAMLSSRIDREEVRWFLTVPGRRAVVWSQPRSLWYRDMGATEAVRLVGPLPEGTEPVTFLVAPDGSGVAWVKRTQGAGTSLEWTPLPATSRIGI